MGSFISLLKRLKPDKDISAQLISIQSSTEIEIMTCDTVLVEQTYHNIYLHTEGMNKLLYWDEPSQSIKIGGDDPSYTNTQFIFSEEQAKDSSSVATEMFLAAMPDMQIVVASDDKRINVIQKRTQLGGSDYTQFYRTPADGYEIMYIGSGDKKSILCRLVDEENTIGAVDADTVLDETNRIDHLLLVKRAAPITNK